MERVHPLFIVNSLAGGGKGRRAGELISGTYGDRCSIVYPPDVDAVENAACRASTDGFTQVVAVGGDGTIHHVVNGLMRTRHRLPLAIVPVGTSNDLARSLGIPRDVASAADAVFHGNVAPIDVVRCGDRYMVNAGGVGLDAVVVDELRRSSGRIPLGRARYLIHGVRELMRFRNVPLVVTVDNVEVANGSCLMVAVGNGRYFGGGMKICPDASMADGQLDICIGHDLTRRETLALMPRVFVGAHVGHPKVEMHQGRSIRIEGPEGMRLQLDGEPALVADIAFSVEPAAIQIVRSAACRESRGG